MRDPRLSNFSLETAVQADAQGSAKLLKGCTWGCGPAVGFLGLLFVKTLFSSYGNKWGDLFFQGVALVLSSAVLWGLIHYRRKSEESAGQPGESPLFKQMESFGVSPPELEEEIRRSGQQVGSLVCTPRFILQTVGMALHKSPEACWVYQRSTKLSVNHLPLAKTDALIVHMKNGTTWVHSDSIPIENVLKKLTAIYPHLVVGYSKELEELWGRSRSEFLARANQ